MPKQIPCLWFDGQAEEAATLYASLFPNSSVGDVTRYGPDMPPPMKEGDVMTVSFTLDGQEYTALNGGPQFSFTEAVSLVVRTRGQEETDRYWDALLADGGEPSMCGWLKDRFGVSWQVVPTRFNELFNSADPEVAGRVGQALFSMKKIIIADLEAAAAG